MRARIAIRAKIARKNLRGARRASLRPRTTATVTDRATPSAATSLILSKKNKLKEQCIDGKYDKNTTKKHDENIGGQEKANEFILEVCDGVGGGCHQVKYFIKFSVDLRDSGKECMDNHLLLLS